MKSFFLLLAMGILTALWGAEPQNMNTDKLKVGLYVDYGSRGTGVFHWVLLLENSPDMELRLLDGDDVANDRLGDLDLIVMPGGIGFTQWESMQEDKGGDNLRKYVREGGKYFGTCAGEALILNEPRRVPMMPFERTPGRTTGGMTAKVVMTDEGAELLGLPKTVYLDFFDGPLVKPTAPMDQITCEVLGSFDCELSSYGPVVRPMYGTPAVFYIHYGKGELFVTSCHPEKSLANHAMIIGGIRVLTGKTVRLTYPKKKFGAARVAFYCPGIGGKEPMKELLAMASREDVDLFPITAGSATSGFLDHVDYLFVTAKSWPDNESLFSSGSEGVQIRAFVERGGKIIRSASEIQ